MIQIVFNEKENRSIAYDNRRIVGECAFTDEGEKWNIIHTEVNQAYQGKGIARKLVEKVLENASKKQKKIIASCGYAQKIINEE